MREMILLRMEETKKELRMIATITIICRPSWVDMIMKRMLQKDAIMLCKCARTNEIF